MNDDRGMVHVWNREQGVPAAHGAHGAHGVRGVPDAGARTTQRKVKIAAVGAVVLALALAALDLLVLRGDVVARATVGLGPNDAATLQIDQVGREHLVEIDTVYRRRGEKTGRAVQIRLEDPSGGVVYETSELVSRKERMFEFTPAIAGGYRLTLRPGGLIGGSSSGSARVQVLVGDRRILGRLLSWLPL